LYAWHNKTLTVGSAIALISLIENAYTPIAIFNVLFVQYKLDKETYKRFEAFLKLKDDPQLEQGLIMQELSGEILVENLCFAYGNKNIFRNLNLVIRPGEKVAFVGASGSGKTTLIKIIIGLLKYKMGNVKLDGEEISNLSLNYLYENLSYISQDTPVFDGSVKENIVFDLKIEDNIVEEALEKVQLYPTINKMKDGINTMVGEKGITLSGGERQRMALARLWFQKNNLVILDEATSAMDNLIEKAVMNEVVHLLSGKTVLAIAHRLSSIKGFDRIVVFRDGEIVGQGTFLELMEHNSYFAELYKISALS
jgi:ATP-binding cassette subfamily B protein